MNLNKCLDCDHAAGLFIGENMKNKINENYGWEKLNKLPEETVKIIENNNACKRAVQKLIEEAVKHYEKSDIATVEIWSALSKEYNLEMDGYEYQIKDGHIYKRSNLNKTVNDIYNDLDFRKSFGDIIRRSLESNT